MTTIVFPGQGSQYKGMGKSLFEKYPSIVSQTSDTLGYAIDEICLHNRGNLLNNTKYSQPAIYLCNALAYLDHIEKEDVTSGTYFAGHSLGEYNALFAAGYFDFLTGLRIVIRRADLMSGIQGGAMLAVVGLDLDAIQEQISSPDLSELEIANFNTPSQFVLSGDCSQITLARERFKRIGARVIVLKTSGPFHSKKMKPTIASFTQYIENISVTKPTHTAISSVAVKPFSRKSLKSLLIRQLVSPVRWTETIQSLIVNGEHGFIELGASTVLTGLCNSILQSSLSHKTDTSRTLLKRKTLFGYKNVIFTPDKRGYVETF